MTRRRHWLRELVQAADQMLWGSLVPVYRKCGKPNCHCAQGEKHGPAWYLSRSEGGGTRMQFVPGEQLEAVQQGVAAFQRFRRLGQQLAAHNLAKLQRRRREKAR